MGKLLFWSLTICFFIFFIGFFLLSEKYSQSMHFVDEDDHLVIGYFINQGSKLYREISTNHQPIPYFLSSLIQKISKPDSLFFLLKRSREAVFLYAFLWSLVLFRKFKLSYLIFAIFYESSKFFLLGNLMLAESLAVYPLIYILGFTLKSVFQKHRPEKSSLYIFGFANFLLLFTLLPLLPSLLIIDVLFFLKTKKIKKAFLGFIIPTILIFLFINPLDWFRETVFYNIKYVAPALSPAKNIFDYAKFCIFPFWFFLPEYFSLLGHFINIFSLLLVFNLLFIFFTNKKLIWLWLVILISIAFLNNRVLDPKILYYYNGFHLLPWYSSFIFFNVLSLKFLTKKTKKRFSYIGLIILIIGGISLLFNSKMPYFEPTDKNYEHNINFYPYFLIGEGIKSLAISTDKMSVLPDESLIYWQSGVLPASKQIVYYEWQYWVPTLKDKFNNILTKNLPEFIYADFKRIGPATYLDILNQSLASNYWQVTRDGVAQNLFISKNKIKTISANQWLQWEELGFDKISL